LVDLGLVENGTLAVRDGRVVAAGPSASVEPSIKPLPGCAEVDAGGAVVMPGFVDCHTHTVFAAYRLDEYEKRVTGVPYAEIASKGGGIAKSVSHVRNTDEGTLRAVSEKRLAGCIRHGSTTIEIKSGYGLDLENELKQLRVIRELQRSSPAEIVPTYLGAHAIPPEYADRREEFISLVTGDMLAAVVEEGLAEAIDVFSENAVFTTDEAERILRAGMRAGLKSRVHADELNDTASSEMAVRVGAASADFAPAREMVRRGMAVAVATDFNPGSSPSESMPMMISIACSHMGLTPAEAIAASTYNAAFVLSRENEVGSLEPGKRADFLILDCEDYREIPYRFGTNPVGRVFIEGKQWAG
jgi:imidazolonepropionase